VGAAVLVIVAWWPAPAVVPNTHDGKAIATGGGLPVCYRLQERQSATIAKSDAETRTGRSSGRVLSIESGQFQARVGNAASAGGTSFNYTMLARKQEWRSLPLNNHRR